MTILLSKEDCYQCKMTEVRLNQLGVDYQVMKMDDDDSALERAKSLGYMSAPVVIAPDGTHWSGFRPDLIDALVA